MAEAGKVDTPAGRCGQKPEGLTSEEQQSSCLTTEKHKDTHQTSEEQQSSDLATEKQKDSHQTTEEQQSSDLASPVPAHDTINTTVPEVVIEKVPDGSGSTITLGRLFGKWIAPIPSLLDQIVCIQQYSFHPSDILLIGYPKSGTHWLWEMSHMLLKGRAEHCRWPKERLMFSFSTQEFFASLPPPRVFNAHMHFADLPAAITTGQVRCKILYVLRNPKDVCVSFYHHVLSQADFQYTGQFHDFIDLFLKGTMPGGSWFDFVLGWERTIQEHPELPVLVIYYEDIKKDPVAELRTISAFLGTDCSEEVLRDISRECSLKRMKQVDRELKEHLSHLRKFTYTETGENFILRKGEVGDWRNHFSPADNERFMQTVNSKLRDSSLHFRYTLED